MYTPNLHFTAGAPTLTAPVPTSLTTDTPMSDAPIPPSLRVDTPCSDTPVVSPRHIDTPIPDTTTPSTLRIDTATTQISGTSLKDALQQGNRTLNTSRVGSSSPSTIVSRKPLPYPLDEQDSIAYVRMPTPLVVITAASNGPMQNSRAQRVSATSTLTQDIPITNTTIFCTSTPSIAIARATPPRDVFPGSLVPGSPTRWAQHSSTPVAIATSSSVEGVLDADRPTARTPISTTTLCIRTDTPTTSTPDNSTLAINRSPAKPKPAIPSTLLTLIQRTPNFKSLITPHVPTTGPSTPRTSSPNNPQRPSWAIDQPPHSLTFHPYQDLVSPPRTLRIAASTSSHFGPARVPKGLIVDGFARYYSSSHTIWIAVRKIQITKNRTTQGSTCSDSLAWMTWCTYLKSEVAKKPWMRVRSGEYSNTFGRLSEEAVARAWAEEDERSEEVGEAWKGSFACGRCYRRSLRD